ncbi:ribophorin i [Lichtheimia corymbifera JMRC:FSU:9682]|uniref:Dolichyl-diphosphooligosaccharide--protein glycosyltransferase subunit 1 n=1 Tax=Lichtheimia corymbifera JMRC:FSU:9682 TaxID=1263082 RepID=A0A068RLV2_9FUNG|nr:ribophorin i [Lichtheimia corymbifera JMRC:FSU:9682]
MQFSVRTLLGALLFGFLGLSLVSASPSSEAVAKTTIPIDPTFRNTRLIRVVDLRSGVVHEDIGIRAKNIDKASATEYIFTIPKNAEEHVASITAFLRQEPKTPLSIEQAGFDSEKELQLYKITFDTPVKPNDEIRFGLKIASTHKLAPFPAKVPQVSRQFVVYNDNVYVYSPYFTDEMKTTVQLPSQVVQSYTGGKHATHSGNKIVYGPFHDMTPGSYQELSIHYEYSKPILTVAELERDLQVSHWGNNLAVEENYKLQHSGARLETEFSRVTYQMTRMVHGQTNVLKDLTFKLPAQARDVYYRDEIGNVSTSHFRQEADGSVLQLTPRYPLFGGWNYTWFHGYNVDLSRFDRYSSKTGQHILNVNFVENVQDMVIDKAVLRVVLPEGVTNVKVHAPFSLDLEEHGTHFTNFDSTGRYLVVLEKFNVVREHEQPIQITYEYPPIRLLQKPLVVSAAIFALFLLSIIVSKISFTIGTTTKKKQ